MLQNKKWVARSVAYTMVSVLGIVAYLAVLCALPVHAQQTLTGQTAFTDYSQEHPGVRRKLTVADLSEPYATQSVSNDPYLVPRPAGALPQAPPGFKVQLYADGFMNARLLRTAPNGDLFLADCQAGEIEVLRGVGREGKANRVEVFASDLTLPFGINFYPNGPNPEWVYVANTDSIVRFPYRNGDMKARGPAETVVEKIPGYSRLHGGGHWTHDIVFSSDGKHMFVSVGSRTNDEDTDNNPADFQRADVLEFTSGGKFERIYADGIRNCVGEAINPVTGELWCSTNERDALGDNLVPDYITHLQDGGFYGWPWFYMGGHQDPRHVGKHPELQAKVSTPDILLQPHFASLEMLFYTGPQFPSRYAGWGFAAEHGSWNKDKRAGYEVITLPMRNGHATGSMRISLQVLFFPMARSGGVPWD
jgi:glucose/arabinose dehydrogenase